MKRRNQQAPKVNLKSSLAWRRQFHQEIQQYIEENKERVAEERKTKALAFRSFRSMSMSKLRSVRSGQIGKLTGQTSLLKANSAQFIRDTETASESRPKRIEGGAAISTKIKTTITKREIIDFENQKAKYLAHISKMSPQKASLIHKSRQKFEQQKAELLRRLFGLITANRLISSISAQVMADRHKRIKMAHVTMVCREFIRILKAKNKPKASPIMGANTCLNANVQLFGNVIYPTALTKAQNHIKQTVVWYFTLQKLYQIGLKSQKLVSAIRFVQQFWRLKRSNIKGRCLALAQKMHPNLNEKDQLLLAERHYNHCAKVGWKYATPVHALRAHMSLRELDGSAQKRGVRLK